MFQTHIIKKSREVKIKYAEYPPGRSERVYEEYFVGQYDGTGLQQDNRWTDMPLRVGGCNWNSPQICRYIRYHIDRWRRSIKAPAKDKA